MLSCKFWHTSISNAIAHPVSSWPHLITVIYCIIDVCPFWVKSLNKHPSMTFPYIYRNRPQRQQHTRTAIPKTHQKTFQRKFPFLNNEIRLCVHWPKRPTQNTHIHSHYNRNLTSNLFLSFNHKFDRVSCT